jgi:hypothetical protein
MSFQDESSLHHFHLFSSDLSRQTNVWHEARRPRRKFQEIMLEPVRSYNLTRISIQLTCSKNCADLHLVDSTKSTISDSQDFDFKEDSFFKNVAGSKHSRIILPTSFKSSWTSLEPLFCNMEVPRLAATHQIYSRACLTFGRAHTDLNCTRHRQEDRV